jgi:2'-5' RNA ligase
MHTDLIHAAGEFSTVMLAQGHSSAMVAGFPVDPRQLTALLIKPPAGGTLTTPEELHLTLAYIGEVAGKSVRDRDAADTAVARVAARWPVLRGEISGVARFRNGEDDQDALVVLFDAGGLPELRYDLVQALERAGLTVDRTHGFTPHLTLAYLPKDAPTPEITLLPFMLTFNALTLAWGDWQIRHALTGKAWSAA